MLIDNDGVIVMVTVDGRTPKGLKEASVDVVVAAAVLELLVLVDDELPD